MNAQPDPIRAFVGDKIAVYEPVVVHAPGRRRRKRRQVRSGWSPIDAINWAVDRDKVQIFRECVLLVRLCADERARSMPAHRAIHACLGLRECVGPQILVQTTQSLGISDARARRLVAQMDAEDRYREGMAGGAL
jgi:hypothetical protein